MAVSRHMRFRRLATFGRILEVLIWIGGGLTALGLAVTALVGLDVGVGRGGAGVLLIVVGVLLLTGFLTMGAVIAQAIARTEYNSARAAETLERVEERLASLPAERISRQETGPETSRPQPAASSPAEPKPPAPTPKRKPTKRKPKGR